MKIGGCLPCWRQSLLGDDRDSRRWRRTSSSFPSLVYRTGAYAPNGIPFANGFADYLNLVNERDGGINGVKITYRGMRDRLRHRPRRRMLRAPEGQGPDRRRAVHPAVDRHHLRADGKGAGRQDPALDQRLRPRRERATATCSPGTSRSSAPTGTPADILIEYIAKELGGWDKLKGKKIALVYHDSPYGKEPIPLLRRWRKQHGFELEAAAGDASRRRAEGDLAADPPAPARLRAAVGLGRDELDGDQGSRRGRLSARQDDRRLVGRRRARRVPAEDAAKGYKALALTPAGRISRCTPTSSSISTTRTWASPSARMSAACSTTAA